MAAHGEQNGQENHRRSLTETDRTLTKQYSTFEKVPVSDIKSSQRFSFGSGKRLNGSKVYLGSEYAMSGQQSPGPKYKLQDNLQFKKPPGGFSFGGAPRAISVTKPQYSYYGQQDNKNDSSDLTKVSTSTIWNSERATMGKERRMIGGNSGAGQSPGPIYYPKRPMLAEPKYTMGKGTNKLEYNSSTSPRVGPGRYNIDTSRVSPRQSFNRAKRVMQAGAAIALNQSYDPTFESCKKQVVSQRKSAPSYSISKQPKDVNPKQGQFRSAMSTNYPRVSIQMRNL